MNQYNMRRQDVLTTLLSDKQVDELLDMALDIDEEFKVTKYTGVDRTSKTFIKYGYKCCVLNGVCERQADFTSIKAAIINYIVSWDETKPKEKTPKKR